MKVVNVAAVPASNSALGETGLGVEHYAAFVKELGDTQAITAAAGPRWVVEGEQPRLQLVDGMAAARAGITGREQGLRRHLPWVQWPPRLQSVPGGLEGFGQSQLEVFAHLEAVHHHIDPVFLLLVECGDVVEIHHMPSTRTRIKPAARICSNTCRCSPLRPDHRVPAA